MRLVLVLDDRSHSALYADDVLVEEASDQEYLFEQVTELLIGRLRQYEALTGLDIYSPRDGVDEDRFRDYPTAFADIESLVVSDDEEDEEHD